MTTFEAGSRVKKGYYFSARSWTLQPVSRDGEALAGKSGERFVRVPLLLAFAVAPLMGAAFLMFLPLIGFLLAAHAAVRPVVRLFSRSATEIAATMQPGWVPGEAHLAGKRGDHEAGEQAPPADAELASLEKEIEEKRNPRS